MELQARALEARALVFQRCRENVNAFCEYVLRDEETRKPIEQLPFHVEIQAALTKHRKIVVLAHPESGKRLAVHTEIPTPDGWRTMGALRAGDRVFGGDGFPCNVTYASPVALGDMFEVVFEDGATLLADAEHQWLAKLSSSRGGGRAGARIVTTQHMLDTGLRESDDRFRWRVPVCGPVQHARHRLPIHPYVLGAWLGDGISNSAALVFAESDRFIWDRCISLVGGRPDHADSGRSHIRQGTLGDQWGRTRRRLRLLGVLGKGRKCIPAQYLRAAEADRRELLAGLLDTDGSISNGSSGGSSRVELCVCNEQLATGALELIRSLGFKASMVASDAVLDGRVVGKRYRITFTAREPVFKLRRKLDRQKLGDADRVGGKQRWKAVAAIRRIPTEPARCIAVDSDDHTYLAGRHYTVTHNTNQLAIGRVLWELGRNPNLRVMILNHSQEKARNTLSAIKKYIETSEELHHVFPDLRRGDVWQDVSITVQRLTFAKEASITAVGYNSSNVVGARVDLLIVDDLLNGEITDTEVQRRKASKWFRTTVLPRTTTNAMVAFCTNAWHPRDLANELTKERGWHMIKRPIRLAREITDAQGNKRVVMKSAWPQRWPESRIKEFEKVSGSLEFARVFMCEPRDEGDLIFKPAFITSCKARGKGVGPVAELEFVPERCVVISAVDIGSRRVTGANTSIFTLFIHPDGTRQPLWLESGRWGATELLERVVSHGVRFKGFVAVENNGVQQHIVELAREAMTAVVPVIPFTTGAQKADPRFGVASMAAEMEAARWIMPTVFRGIVEQNVCEDFEEWHAEMLDYTPEAHTGDRLMASWIAREVGRKLHHLLIGGRTAARIGVQVLG